MIGIGGIMILALSIALLAAQPLTPMLVEAHHITYTISILLLLLIPFIGLFGFLMYKAYMASKIKKMFTKYPTGKGRAVDDISPGKEGYIIIDGEYWKAKSSVHIKAGSVVLTVGHYDGGILSVEPTVNE
jgi:membrane-bound serine protease (ClpP class)